MREVVRWQWILARPYSCGWGACSLEIVQTVADRPERRLVEAPIHGDGGSRVLNRGGRLGERHHRPPLEQPDQPRFVIAAQPAVARVWLLRRVEAEEVAGGPAECLGLVAPLGQEPPAVLDGGPPAGNRDEIGAAGFEGLEDAAEWR